MLRPITVAPMLAIDASITALLSLTSPPCSPWGPRQAASENTHSCGRCPPTPNGWSTSCPGPATKPSRERVIQSRSLLMTAPSSLQAPSGPVALRTPRPIQPSKSSLDKATYRQVLPDPVDDEGEPAGVDQVAALDPCHGHLVAFLEVLGGRAGQGVAPLAGLQHPAGGTKAFDEHSGDGGLSRARCRGRSGLRLPAGRGGGRAGRPAPGRVGAAG